jgi:chromosome segregation ATPase
LTAYRINCSCHFQNELSKLREQFESDFSIWKREFEAATKLRECEKENLIRHQCRLERDHQIDSIVNKMDDEALKHQQEFELKLSRMREKFEAEIRDLEFNEKTTKEKFVETRSKLAESEANIQNLEATVKQLQIQLGHTQKICDTYSKEKDNMKDSARQEIQSELKAMQRDHSSEIHRIYTR